jgi:hypothetical protein
MEDGGGVLGGGGMVKTKREREWLKRFDVGKLRNRKKKMSSLVGLRPITN